MKKFLAITAIALTVFTLGFKATGDWILFENTTCKVFFPSSPKHDSTEVESAVGKLKLYTHMLEVAEAGNDSNLVYGLIETQYPPAALPDKYEKAYLKGFFDGAVSGAVKNINGKLISEKDITLKEIPGKEIKIDYGSGLAVVTIRFYLNKLRLHAVQTIAYIGKENNSTAKKFFDSFDIK